MLAHNYNVKNIEDTCVGKILPQRQALVLDIFSLKTDILFEQNSFNSVKGDFNCLPPAVLELELQQVTDAHLTLLIDEVLAVHEGAALVLSNVDGLAARHDDLLAFNFP